MATHYEVLGVAPDVSPAVLRAAYLAKARALHPDHHTGQGRTQLQQAERAMQEVNAAWTVLNDPRARREYDRTLERARTVFGEAGDDGASRPFRMGPPMVVLEDDDDDFADGPRGVWPHLIRIAPVVLLLGVLATIFIVTAFAAGGRSVDLPSPSSVAPGTPDVGTCIDVARDNATVSCDAPTAVRVERRAPAGDDCAGGTVPVRWDDDVVLCVRPPS